jgi:hypothetical protein
LISIDCLQEDFKMKNIIITSAAIVVLGMGVSFGANATVCLKSTLCVVADSTTDYIVDGFSLQLSTGVALTYVQSATAVGVGTFHPKGNSGFAGISSGGQIIECGTAAAMPTVVSSGSGATGC